MIHYFKYHKTKFNNNFPNKSVNSKTMEKYLRKMFSTFYRKYAVHIQFIHVEIKSNIANVYIHNELHNAIDLENNEILYNDIVEFSKFSLFSNLKTDWIRFLRILLKNSYPSKVLYPIVQTIKSKKQRYEYHIKKQLGHKQNKIIRGLKDGGKTTQNFGEILNNYL